MTALSKHQGEYGKPCPLRQSEEVSSPTLASSSLSSTCSFLLYPQGLSCGCQPGERHDGQEIKPDILPTWSHLSLSLSGAFPLVHNNRRQEAISLGAPETSEPLTAVQGPYFRSSPPPQVSPFPGVSRPSGPLPAVSPSPVPISGPSAHTRARGHSPARRRAERGSRRQEPRLAARTEQTRTPQPAGPALAPEVTFESRVGGAHPGVRMSELCSVGLGLITTWWPGLCS